MSQLHPLAPGYLVPNADPNALAVGVWPEGTRRTDATIEMGGVGLDALAAEYGTPLMVIDEQVLRDRAAAIRQIFERAFSPLHNEVHVYYAGKALLTIDVARMVAAEGLRIDVCSGGELAVALAAQVPGDRIGFHGNNKSTSEIEAAVAAGVGTIVVDSEIEIERIAQAAAAAGVSQAVRLRINVGVHASTHEYLATSHEDQKFGVTIDDASRLVERIRSFESLRFLGLHTHIGSQIVAHEGFIESARRMLELHASLLGDGPVPELNLGGGFGIRYVESDEEPSLADFAKALAEFLRGECERLSIPIPAVAFEPGRWIAGPAGVTVYTVGTVKRVQLGDSERVYVSVDGGMSDNARPALYEAHYSARLANRESEAPAVLARVAGKHCESGDIVVDAEWLPGDVQAGDLLAVPATGAYCASLSSNYNYLMRPAMVAVAGGNSRVLVRRETMDDLLARDAGRQG
ncbi:diaminopimelate decarboxylase [Humidisolicoccus flavus]|uniref:diaminopimelate decarboxylase n=1 Tax=Humidisolicoccus flavus TaxID=3111414 RepID=UPI003245CCF9